VRFAEKQPGGGLINAGIYVFSRAALAELPVCACSLERDILPDWVARGMVAGLVVEAPLLDIGLPETYAAAPAFLAMLSVYR
jgi:NDP-sugar pyrophosphorylase family protein